jgi:hypothetical protein
VISNPAEDEERAVDPMMKRKVAGGVAALVVLAGAGGAYAVAGTGSDARGARGADRNAFLDDVAKRLHVSRSELTAALKGATAAQLDREVAAGRLTRQQADEIKRHVDSDGDGPLGGPGFHGGPRLGGPPPGAMPYGGPPGPPAAPGSPPPPPPNGAPRRMPRALPPPGFQRRGAHRGPDGPGGPLGAVFDAAAKYLGVTRAQLGRELWSGKSLADVAKAKGKDVAGLKDAISNAFKGQLDELVNRKGIGGGMAGPPRHAVGPRRHP